MKKVKCDQINFPLLNSSVKPALWQALRAALPDYVRSFSLSPVVNRHAMPKYKTLNKRTWLSSYITEHVGECASAGKIEKYGERYFVIEGRYLLLIRKARTPESVLLDLPNFVTNRADGLYSVPLIPVAEGEVVKHRLDDLEPYILVYVADKTGNLTFYLVNPAGEGSIAHIELSGYETDGGEGIITPAVNPDAPITPIVKLKKGVVRPAADRKNKEG